MTRSTPWWYSAGDDQEPTPDSAPAGQSAAGSSAAGSSAAGSSAAGLGDLVAAAGGLMGWAADRMLAPHAEHEDPRDHPQCLLCRAQRILGEAPFTDASFNQAPFAPTAAPSGDSTTAPATSPEHSAMRSGIRWIPIDEDDHGREWSGSQGS